MVPKQFHLDIQPVASSDATVCLEQARFTILTERLIRLEYAPDGKFEDRSTQTMWYRQQPVPQFTTQQEDQQLTIETEAFSLCYQIGQPFTPESLSIHVKSVDAEWHPGADNTGNLKGTTRTLDGYNGYAPLTDGLISRDGWALLDDSKSFVFNDEYWLEVRDTEETDWYFFAYGHDYKIGLQDYCAVL